MYNVLIEILIVDMANIIMSESSVIPVDMLIALKELLDQELVVPDRTIH
jgi:hypothetical protein